MWTSELLPDEALALLLGERPPLAAGQLWRYDCHTILLKERGELVVVEITASCQLRVGLYAINWKQNTEPCVFIGVSDGSAIDRRR